MVSGAIGVVPVVPAPLDWSRAGAALVSGRPFLAGREVCVGVSTTDVPVLLKVSSIPPERATPSTPALTTARVTTAGTAMRNTGPSFGHKARRVGAGDWAEISRTRALRACGAAGRLALSSSIRSGDVIVSHPLFQLSECAVQPRRDRGGCDPEQFCRFLAREIEDDSQRRPPRARRPSGREARPRAPARTLLRRRAPRRHVARSAFDRSSRRFRRASARN